MENCLCKNDKIEIHQKQYRILQIVKGIALLAELNITKMKLGEVRLSELLRGLKTGEVQLINSDNKQNNILEFRECQGRSKEIQDRYRDFQEEIECYSTDYSWLLCASLRAPFIQEFAKKQEISCDTVRRMLRKYLQSGMDLNQLRAGYDRCGGKGKTKTYTNGIRPGRKGLSSVVRDETVLYQFDIMVQRLKASKGRLSFTQLYEDLIRNFYSEKQVVNGETTFIPYPCVMRPTQKQLYYYVKTQISEREKYQLQHGKRKAWNNIRPLHSDTISDLDIRAIGARYEIDEMETDYELVSRADRNSVIGRAILYLVVDVFSRMLVGYSVGFDNNSWAGVEMALLNMAEDKVEVCKRLGIEIEEKDWPVHDVLPMELLSDNGSEYLSSHFEDYVKNTGVELSFAPAAMGSMKANVEQKFHQFNSRLKGTVPGEIRKDSYGQPHKKSARLTIEEFEQIVVQFILNYNKNPMDQYPLSREQFQDGITPSPLAIWNHSLQGVNGLKKISDMDQYRLCLMTDGKASLTRNGIEFKKMIYTCSDLEWLSEEMVEAALNGAKKISIKYDKRNMDYIYFVKQSGEIVQAWISKRKASNNLYWNLSFYEVEQVNNVRKEQKKENAEERMQNNMNYTQRVKEIVKQARRKHTGPNSMKDIRDNRLQEKEALHKERYVTLEEVQSEEMLSSLDGKATETKIHGVNKEQKSSFEDKMAEIEKKSTYDLIREKELEKFKY